MKKAKWVLMIVMISLVLSACSSKSNLKDGTYSASAKGHEPGVVVETVISNGAIEQVTVKEHNETPGYFEEVVEKIPAEIVKQQSLGIDTVSGATLTSRAIIDAAADCIVEAGGDAAALGYKGAKEISMENSLTISGEPFGEIILSAEELLELPSVTQNAVSIDSKGEKTEMAVKGVLLNTILEKNNAKQSDYASILSTATDGYSIEIPSEIISKRDIIIAYEIDKEPIDLRIVIPDERAMYWAKFLVKLECKKAQATEKVSEVVLMETAFEQQEAEDYKYYDSVDKAIPTQVLLDTYGKGANKTITLFSNDGLKKNEQLGIFQSHYIKTTGEEAPLFIGPNLPEGMRVKKLLCINLGQTAWISVQSALEEAGSKSITLNKLLNCIEISNADKYSLITVDGSSTEIGAEDMKRAKVSMEGTKAVINLNNKTIKDLLYIKAK